MAYDDLQTAFHNFMVKELGNVETKSDMVKVKDALAQISDKLDKVLAANTGTPPVVTPPVVTPPVVTPPASTGGVFIGTTEFPTLRAASAAYKPGDEIRITKSLDNDGGVFANGNVTITGSPGVKMTWSAGLSLPLPWHKALLVFPGTPNMVAVVRNLDISGGNCTSDDGGNGSGIRVDDGMASLTVDNCTIHDCDNGMLGGAKNTIITNSRFYNNGMGRHGYTHNIYLPGYTDQLTVSDTFFGAVDQGNLSKSRAKATTYIRCVFDPSGKDGSYQIDIPDGGHALVKDCVLYKAAGQSQHYMLTYGSESMAADGRINAYEFANNIVLTDDTAHFILMPSGGQMNFHDNKIVGQIDGVIGNNNQIFANRAAAGFPASGLPVHL